MHEAGVEAVLNVQTDIDIVHRGIDWPLMCSYYEQRDIVPVHFPIHDFNAEDLEIKLYGAACELKKLRDLGRKVYVHCTAGMGRAPATVVVYLCLFEDWDPVECDLYLKTHRKVCVPNMRVVQAVVNKHKS